MPFDQDCPPTLSDALTPPTIRGTADLAGFASLGHGHEDLLERIGRFHRGAGGGDDAAARLHDTATALQLAFRPAEGLTLQDEALGRCQIYRVQGTSDAAEEAGGDQRRPLRLLAVVGPGDLMVNTPIDFITSHLNVRLDLLYILPDRPLPPVIPDHDVVLFALSEADPALLARLRALFAAWPRPALNDPKFLPAMARDALPRSLAGAAGICSPTTIPATRAALAAHLQSARPIEGFDTPRGLYPCLIRPLRSHAGHGLSLVATPAELAEYLRLSSEMEFFVTAFENYRGPDGQYRKLRIAFVDRHPFLCHMAVSGNWMVHYLNAGMTSSAAKRDEEAQAMAGFDAGFARRHEAAFAALHERLGFDYYSIDCAETPDGRLLVFEADNAAIIHLMDPADLFPYKPPQMRRIFAAIGDLLHRRAACG